MARAAALGSLLALIFALGCPAETKGPSPEAAANAQRTLDAMRGQAQRRFDELKALPQESQTRAEDEAAAIKELKGWLTQRRQWRAEPYRIRVAPLEGPALDRAGLEALIKAGQPVALELSVPELEPAPGGRREFQDPQALAPLLDLLAPESSR